jgi:type VI secretion system ImpM family protein
MSAGVVVGVYGKIESQADFFRTNSGEFSQAGLDRWFEEALETMRSEGGHLPEGPTGFVLAPPGAEHVFIGTFSPSNDAVGRSFPLIVFAALRASALLESLPAVWHSYGAFFQGAAALAAGGRQRPGAELVAEAEALARNGVPATASLNAAAVLAREPAQDVVGALGGVPRALGYALRTLSLACDQASKTGPEARTGVITVDAPVPTPAVFQLWLEVAQRRLRWRDGVPSLLWLDGDPYARLLLTLGAPSQFAFAYLANPGHRSPRLWPLRTQVGSAMEQALQALTPEQHRVVENPRATLGELVGAFG